MINDNVFNDSVIHIWIRGGTGRNFSGRAGLGPVLWIVGRAGAAGLDFFISQAGVWPVFLEKILKNKLLKFEVSQKRKKQFE